MNIHYTPNHYSHITGYKFKAKILCNNCILFDEGPESLYLTLDNITAEECYHLSDMILTIAHSKDPVFKEEILKNETKG